MSDAKSRHTPMGTTLKRSYGITDDQDLVVSMCSDRTVRVHAEPTTRKLRRGEQLEEVVIDIDEAWRNRAQGSPLLDFEHKVARVLRRLPIADLSGPAEKVGYLAKIWLMRELAAEFEKK
jgi:hypothetical protein